MQGSVLNQSLVNALGRPDLAFQAQANSAYSTITPVIGTSPGAGLQLEGTSTRGAGIALLVLIGALGGFIYWVHPHLL